KGFVHRVHDFEQVEILRADHSVLAHLFQIENSLPVISAVEDDGDRTLDFLSLNQCQDFKKFIQGTESAREGNQCPCGIDQPELADKEVVKLEREIWINVGVWVLFERQTDIKTDGVHACFFSAAVAGLHDARSTS